MPYAGRGHQSAAGGGDPTFGGWEDFNASNVGSLTTLDSSVTHDGNENAINPSGTKVASLSDDGTDVYLQISDADSTFSTKGTKIKLQDAVAAVDNDSRFGGVCFTSDLVVCIVMADATLTNDPHILTYTINDSTNACTFADSDNLSGGSQSNALVLQCDTLNTDRALAAYLSGADSGNPDISIMGISVNSSTGVITLDASETDIETADNTTSNVRQWLATDGEGDAIIAVNNTTSTDIGFFAITDGGTSTSAGTETAVNVTVGFAIHMGLKNDTFVGFTSDADRPFFCGDTTGTTINNINFFGLGIDGWQASSSGGSRVQHVATSGSREIFATVTNPNTPESNQTNTDGMFLMLSFDKSLTKQAPAILPLNPDVANFDSNSGRVYATGNDLVWVGERSGNLEGLYIGK